MYIIKNYTFCIIKVFRLIFQLNYKFLLKEIKNESKVSYRDTSLIKNDEQVQQLNTELEKQLQSFNPQQHISNESFAEFEEKFSRVFHKFALIVIRNVSKNNKTKWYSNTLKNLISKRNRFYRAWSLNLSNPLALQRYKIQRLKVEKELMIAKSRFYCEKFENCIGDSGQVYRFLDTTKGKSRKNAVIR